jgi:hypothetical protein
LRYQIKYLYLSKYFQKGGKDSFQEQYQLKTKKENTPGSKFSFPEVQKQVEDAQYQIINLVPS